MTQLRQGFRRSHWMLSVACVAVWLPGCSDQPVSGQSDAGLGRTRTKAVAVVAREGGGNAPEAEVWSGFRGPSGAGISSAKGLPTEWSGDQNIVWKAALPGPGASSPIVWGDRIYTTSYSGYFVPGESGGSLQKLKRHLTAIDRASGKIVWDRTVAARLPEEERIRDHGFAANTPAADADHVYVFFGKSGVIAFTHAGEQVWQTSVGDTTHGWGTSASPVLDQDLVIINASVESGSLVALNRSTGKEVWSADGINEAWNTPVIATAESGRRELLVATHGKLKAFAPDTGTALWNCDTDITWYMVPGVVTHDGIAWCLGGRSGTASFAVRLGGSGDVTKSHRLWTSRKGSNVSSPVFHNGHLYWAHDNLGIVYCADPATGELVYEHRLERAGQFYSSALLAEGRVYYLARNGRTFVIAATPEFEQIAVNDLDDGSLFNASPAVSGNRLLIRSDKYLYCIGQ